jgi:pyruvate kinase
VGTTYEGLAEDVSAGNTILINDGRLKLEVVEVCGHDITCTVVIGGQLTDSKGINLPGVNVSAPALSEKDKGDLQWAIENDVDYIALSFVRRAFDGQHVKRRIEEAGKRIPIISKIEREDAVDNIEEILNESDGIMVARGDLGIEINTERLPVVQKHLITRANARGKLVITATQMLESMIENPFPTRAESSDVANAVFDGTDAIMLSGETAVGSFPVEAVAEMNRIAVEAEESPYMPHHILDEARFQEDTFSVAMTGSCAYLAKTLQAAGVILATHNDLKAILLSKRRGSTNTISVTHDPAQWRRQSMYWGTVPLLVKATNDHQDLLDRAIDEAGRHGLVKTGDTLVVLMGTDGARARTLKVVEA